MDIPDVLKNSKLFSKLAADDELSHALKSLRGVVEALAATTSRTVPSFTDHTIKHMDALWGVAERIITASEIERMTAAEIFLVGSGFYLHDIGMAYAATSEGLERIRVSSPYRGFMAALKAEDRSKPDMEARAIALATRTMHAEVANDFAINAVPGSQGIYLFETQAFREAWGRTCGTIASSHHWSVERLEKDLGSQGTVPLPGHRKGDIAYAAALLRLIDYAHINRDRASTIDRAFRMPLERDSLVHWLAQEHVDGPEREETELVYRAAQPISDVDAWWLYYEMLTGLDNEIRVVRRMLDSRSASQGRLALTGVRGMSSPQAASFFIPTAGFLPIEVNLRTGSIERLVELLAGESLYGPRPMVALRELVQNSRDAVNLKAAVANSETERVSCKLPIKIRLDTKSKTAVLEVEDFGIGMTPKIMTDYLISIASSYWTSQFAIDFPDATERGFKSAGKFGIGFLSVFMLGDRIFVESNRAGGERVQLTLRGVGRRGELRLLPAAAGSGTTIRIELKDGILENITPLADRVRACAPTLPHDIEVVVDGAKTLLSVGWSSQISADDFSKWVLSASLETDSVVQPLQESFLSSFSYRAAVGSRFTPVATERTSIWPSVLPEYRDGANRLLADFTGLSLISLKGLAVQTISTPGFVGVIDLEAASPDVSRSRLVEGDIEAVLNRARASIKSAVIENLDALSHGLIIDKTDFIARCVKLYGKEVILESRAPWISQLKLPGEIQMISCNDFLERARKVSSVFIAYNFGPWTALKEWDKTRSRDQEELAVVLDEEGGAYLSYLSAKEQQSGSLSTVWPTHASASLFTILLSLLAKAWEINLADLMEQPVWVHSEARLSGKLTKQSL